MPALVRALTLAVAVAAVVMLAVAGPGSRFEVWPWGVGLSLMRWAAWTGLAAAVLALVQLVVPRLRRPAPFVLAASLVLGLAAATPPMLMMNRAKQVPAIHDITTDTADPPQFEALKAARDAAPNKSAYAGEEVAAKQRAYYTDLASARLPLTPEVALRQASELAREMGWEVVAQDAASGRLEATATTRWFGFKDDIVVRVRPDGTGSRIDVRSASRVGRSDVGANAARIREFLARLA